MNKVIEKSAYVKRYDREKAGISKSKNGGTDLPRTSFGFKIRSFVQ
jgi:hypothetical protein